ncbi:MAG: ABC transporter permease [Roseiarcus sp.]|jgi:ribose transport system permease protein
MNALASLRRRVAYARPAIAFAAALLAFNVAVDHSFLDPTNWPSILTVAMPFVLISMAAAPVIMSGGIDLSIGPLAGLANAVLIGVLVPLGAGSPFVAVPATIATGAAVGCVNGALVAWLRVPPIIATLGSYLVLSGLTLEILPTAGGRAPDWMIALAGRAGVFPLPLLILAAVALAWLPLRQSAYGRNLLATGGDQRTAFTSGIDVTMVRFVVYVLAGVIAAVTGFAFTVALGSGDPTAAAPYTLIGIAGAVLGGVSLAGGRGGLLGAAAGGAVLFLVQNLLSLAHVSAFYAQIAYGLILLLALALNSIVDFSRRRRERAANLGGV